MGKCNSLAIIANVQLSGAQGGAEIFHQKLYENFCRYVPHVTLLEVPCCENTYEDILRGYQVCYDLDLSQYDAVISSKAPTFAVQHPNHVCYLMHTVRVFYDMFNEISGDPQNVERQKLLFRMDRELLSPPRTRKLFSIGHEVTDRLLEFIGVDSIPLHPGITASGFYCGEAQDYIFMPGRLHKWKRVDLVIQAMKYVKSPIHLKIAGKGDQMEALKAMAGKDERIEFLGYLSEEQIREYYANALAVAFTPVREDYGYILHEAFKSCKPVLTCVDSGEPARFIRQGINGFAAEPRPEELAQWIDYFYMHKEDAAQMGKNGMQDIENITWDHVVQTLWDALD